MSYSVTPVPAERWAQLEEFFGPSGAYAHCWCTWFRQRQKDFDAGARDGGAGNHALLRRLTTGGQVPGLIAHDESGEPVGWVSVGPREHFPRILRSTTLRPEPSQDTENVWAVVCFWVPRRHRGRGVARALLDAAVQHAAANGAATLEGYPVDTELRNPGASGLFTGTLGLFGAAGFAIARARSPERPVVQRIVGPVQAG
ncbi:MAG TPA: GNAT family N-acetyltransferase [Nakamurella sp.]|nr:GNAT family N-acetyltransferase [Nakamurella sp.]